MPRSGHDDDQFVTISGYMSYIGHRIGARAARHLCTYSNFAVYADCSIRSDLGVVAPIPTATGRSN